MSTVQKLKILGWREWVSLPDLDVHRIKCKVDTGARSSALHTYFIERFHDKGAPRVRFGVHPKQSSSEFKIICEADVLDEWDVTDSGGHRERRIAISTTLEVGPDAWPIEITLADRDSMKFRMLLGRSAIGGGYLVNPAISFNLGKIRD
ncbi:MAG: hypothetical protein MAG794_00894 [Gammaproteobacteria bacterium]|nr:hypothetical protein [Gammaproteobacteria bacterium]